MKLKKLFTARVLILIFFIMISLLAIKPVTNTEGVAIRSVETNSSAAFAGMSVPPNLQPTDYERIIEINGQKVNSLEDYSILIEKNIAKPIITEESLFSTINETFTEDNETNSGINETNKTEEPIINPNLKKLIIKTNKGTYTLLNENIGITVDKPATTNILRGLELQGGTRALIQPSEKLDEQQYQDLMATMENRLNVYGIKQLVLKRASDFEGNKYIIVEIAGATKEEVKDLIAKQGKFEAKIGDDVVFKGGERDVTFVCRNDGTCAGIRNCNEAPGGYQCQFEFQIKLSEIAAQKQADVTKNLDINTTAEGYQYLEKPLDLYLDGVLVDTLNIAADLKGKAARDILISGPGTGATQEEALTNSNHNMKKLQTVLITGALPTSLNIVKMDSISPTLGSTFEKNAITVAILAILAVAVVIFIRYRKIKISLPMAIISSSEALIILGFLTLIRYNIDLAAIAGIIAAVGTGVDDQIIIADEVMGKESVNWKERYKKAFFIIIVAYFTTLAAMIPLLWAGGGLLTGFAIATIAGVTIGVFITRPAFASILKVLLNE